MLKDDGFGVPDFFSDRIPIEGELESAADLLCDIFACLVFHPRCKGP